MDAEYLASARRKLSHIYHDLAHNVTHIYNRVPTHLAFDLVAHSVLGFTFKGERVVRGWAEGLIVGDTRVGKSRVAEQLLKHAHLGRMANCERVSFAGLVGGMQQVGKIWNINWGLIPLYDRQMVVLDEVTGLSTEQIGEMSGFRSSGIAEIVKIQQERTPARCRLLWIGNRRKKVDNRMDALSYGVNAVPEVMGRVEDIARLDFALTVSEGDVDTSVMNAKKRPEVPHIYTSEVYHNLMLWAWSRRPEDVVFVDGCEDYILDAATKLSTTYSSEIPIVERSEQRIRLARLSCAMAARLFSTDDGQKLLVRKEHVVLVMDFLLGIYNAKSMRYDAFSKKRNQVYNFTPEQLNDCVDMLRRFEADSTDALLGYLTENDEIDRYGLAEATGWDMDNSRHFINLFTTKTRGLRSLNGRKGLVKTPMLVAALKKMEE